MYIPRQSHSLQSSEDKTHETHRAGHSRVLQVQDRRGTSVLWRGRSSRSRWGTGTGPNSSGWGRSRHVSGGWRGRRLDDGSVDGGWLSVLLGGDDAAHCGGVGDGHGGGGVVVRGCRGGRGDDHGVGATGWWRNRRGGVLGGYRRVVWCGHRVDGVDSAGRRVHGVDRSGCRVHGVGLDVVADVIGELEV